MSIGSVTSIDFQATTAVQHARGRKPDMSAALEPLAEKLGMSVADIKQALESGTTLDRLATSKGVSHDDLVSAIKDGLQNATQGAPVDANFDLDALAEAIATGSASRPPGGTAGPAMPPRGVNSNDQAALESVSSLLDMSTDDLVDALMNGASLTDLAASHGVSATGLLDALGRGLIVNTTL